MWWALPEQLFSGKKFSFDSSKLEWLGFFQSKDHFKNSTPVVKKILEEFNAIITLYFFVSYYLPVNYVLTKGMNFY